MLIFIACNGCRLIRVSILTLYSKVFICCTIECRTTGLHQSSAFVANNKRAKYLQASLLSATNALDRYKPVCHSYMIALHHIVIYINLLLCLRGYWRCAGDSAGDAAGSPARAVH